MSVQSGREYLAQGDRLYCCDSMDAAICAIVCIYCCVLDACSLNQQTVHNVQLKECRREFYLLYVCIAMAMSYFSI